MAGLFITSTGTGIGKTFLTEQLLRFDSTQEQKICATKPIISGWPYQAECFSQTDTGRLILAQKRPLNEETINQVSPWRFHAPLAPSRAAKQEHRKIDKEALMTFCREAMQAANVEQKLHLFEGVGGVMVPIDDKWLVTDWIAALKCSVLLVVGSYLGTISHTLSAVAVLKAHRIPIVGIVVSESPLSDVSLVETLETLEELLPSLPVMLFPKEEKGQLICLHSVYTILLQYLFSNIMAPTSVLV